ncbi:NAD(P)/FAD-dependent oxidoreductase [Gallaecimonas kandeliae]|uniref:NAD(P)/FAD-dependent oxidoreductase n=1 Tax=Gallaecimonas kandeliae TaxID=3029055 RepID=UPI002649B2CA|nr:NAD(P)/FAD-dependent oxidoreductase [Gallaecimonas kandeliae]WKE66389.1 NAD(P)/FAD-dependent oxidoreductase [Gallaecimonas kandeliae]
MAGQGHFDAIIVGAGPAGLALATMLRPELRVLVLERRAQPAKAPPIGESLPGATAVLLQRLQLWERFQQAGHRERGGAVAVWDQESPVWQDAIRDPAGPGWHLDRGRFEAMLRQRALEAGADLLEGCAPSDIRHHQGLWQLATPQGRFQAPVLVDATGRSGSLGRQLGLKRQSGDPLLCLYSFLEQGSQRQDSTLRLQADAQGWWYTVPLPQGQRVLAYHLDGDDPQGRQLRRPEAFLAKARQHPLLAEVLADLPPAQLRCRAAGTSLLPVEELPKAGPGFLAIGDALLAFDPIASQGIFHSLASAASATKAIKAGLDHPDLGLGAYQQEMQAVTQRYLWHLKASYQGPRRFSQEPFWQRRQ